MLSVTLKFGKSKLQKLWALFNLAVGVWGWSMWLIAKQHYPESSALFIWRVAHIGGIFIAVFFGHVVNEFCGIKSNKALLLYYCYGIFFIFLSIFNPNNLYISELQDFYGIQYLKANNLYGISVMLWISIVAWGHLQLLKYYRIVSLSRRAQTLYFLVALVIGFSGGFTYFLPMFGINIFPIGNFTIIIYCGILTYAILKYRVLDIRIVFTRTGIFIGVYSFVLGVPFAVTYKFGQEFRSILGHDWWLLPMVMLTILATAGPFVYLYIQKRAEEQLLKDQRRYQATLSQASAGMGRIKDLNRLLDLIVYIVTRAVRLDHSSVYIYDSIKDNYRMGAFKGNPVLQSPVELTSNSILIKHLIKTKSAVVYEEIKQRVQDYNDEYLSKIEATLKSMDAALVIPSLIEDRLLAIIVLGKKKSGKLFGDDDLSVFSILANQAALAIENAQFYEDVKTTQEQLFQAEKMATIGTMADGLSHQINNRLHALGFIAGDALDTIKLKRNVEMSKEMREVISDLERSLVRIQENVLQGGEVVQGLLRYTRKGEQGFAPVEVDKLVTAALEMAQFKIKTHEMKIIREYDKDGPKIKGNFTQLQEVFFNMIDNAFDAMMQRKNEQKEPGFQPTLRIQTHLQDDRILVKFLDNGIGVKPEDNQKIFTPFFTTKLSSKKGTGLGLYVIKKIVEDNHKGKVTFESKYLEGTTITLNLPIAY